MPFTKEELLATLDPVTFEGYNPRPMKHLATFDDAFDILLELGRRETPAFDLSPDEIQAYRKALAWLLASPSCTNPFGGLYVWGPTGSGKTMLVRLLQRLSKLLGVHRPFWLYDRDRDKWKVAYLPLLWSSATHGETHARDYTTHYQETGKYLDEGRFVLHIGDLGAEPKEAQYYGSRSSVIASIICRRSDQHGERLSRPMVITSNYPPDALSGPNLYDDRTASRIQGDCVIVHLSSTDHRLASAQPRS